MENKLTAEEMAKIKEIRRKHVDQEISIEELDHIVGGATYYVEDGIHMMRDDLGEVWMIDRYVEFLRDCYINVGPLPTILLLGELNSDIADPKRFLLNDYDEFDVNRVRRLLKNKCN